MHMQVKERGNQKTRAEPWDHLPIQVKKLGAAAPEVIRFTWFHEYGVLAPWSRVNSIPDLISPYGTVFMFKTDRKISRHKSTSTDSTFILEGEYYIILCQLEKFHQLFCRFVLY